MAAATSSGWTKGCIEIFGVCASGQKRGWGVPIDLDAFGKESVDLSGETIRASVAQNRGLVPRARLSQGSTGLESHALSLCSTSPFILAA